MNRYRTTKQFLDDIHGDDNINFRLIKEKDKPIKYNAPYNAKTIDHLTQLNNQGYNIYYVVNSGGDKDESINLINSVFIDFDCPKEQKQFPPMDKVDAFKREQMDKINQFKYKPSYIVETRNGLHVYWLVNKDATVEQFKIAQQRLIAYFDSDISIKNPSRVMRLPEYYWTKDMSQKYMVKIKECNINKYDYKPYRYDIESIINELPHVVGLGGSNNNGVNINTSLLSCTPKPQYNNSIGLGVPDKGVINNTSLSSTPKPQTNANELIMALINQDGEYLKEQYNLPQTILSNKSEFNKYIRSVDLRLILGIHSTGSFKCIFHEDSSPSADIFRGDDGASLYKCHSGSCGVSYNIINVVEKLGKFKTRPEAYKFIEKILNIEIVMTENQIKQVESLEENINFLMLYLSTEKWAKNPI